MRVMVASIFSEECHEVRAEHIEGGETGRKSAHPEHPGRMRVGRGQNGVLTEESGEARESRNGETGNTKREEGNGHCLSQAAHVAQILFTREAVDHAARAEEEQGLKESVRHQVKNAGGISA